MPFMWRAMLARMARTHRRLKESTLLPAFCPGLGQALVIETSENWLQGRRNPVSDGLQITFYMKKIHIIILSIILSLQNLLADLAVITIATIDSNKLQHEISHKDIRSLSYDGQTRAVLHNLKKSLAEIFERVVATKNEADLNALSLEATFLKRKITLIESSARTDPDQSGWKVIDAMVKEKFSDKYALIVKDSSSIANYFGRAIHSDVKYVDITPEVAEMIREKLAAVPKLE